MLQKPTIDELRLAATIYRAAAAFEPSGDWTRF